MTLGAKVSSTLRPASSIKGGGYAEPTLVPGFLASGPLTLCALWDNSVDGHLPVQVANGGMGLGVFAPANFFVTIINFEVLVVPVGPTNMGASLEADGDITPSAAISGAPFSSTGMKNGANLGASAVNVAQTVQGPRTTVSRELQLFATVAASTAGRIAFWLTGYASTPLTQGIS